MDDWTKNLKQSGLYYEGWVDDVEQVLDIHKRATVTSYGTRRSSTVSVIPSTAAASDKDTENCSPPESVNKVRLLVYT